MSADRPACPTWCDCERCRAQAANLREWNLEAAEHYHQRRTQEAYRDWIEDNYVPEWD